MPAWTDHASASPADAAPPPATRFLFADRSFVGLLATQFLGAFNDNVFKQMVLLLCLDYKKAARLDADLYQPIATALFTVAFLAFSGFAGFLSDRFRKRNIIVLSKVAEIVVMTAGLITFFAASAGSQSLLWLLIVVLLLMGAQSAFFGPSKYGILPEMLPAKHLPAANGWIQMTTFLAIIFGIALAGFLKVQFAGRLWAISAICVAIAGLGTATSLLIGSRPPAQPNLKFSPSCLVVESSAWRLLVSDKALQLVLFVYSIFWFAGGVVLPTVNEMGKSQLGWPDDLTSMINACMAFGIGIGCGIAGALSRHQIAFWLVRLGAAGTAVAFALVAALAASALPADAKKIWIGVGLFLAGGSAGLLAVPLQVFLQSRPPADQKGRIIGAMNLFTWIGILLSTAYYFAVNSVLHRMNLPPCWVLAALSPIMLGIAIAFWPKLEPKPAR
jgi:acyl-[acyl-carrier-protein]-phospholipid O-acyltransferase/long-chain-fatty-acid--[acyl-carrier-protein] ligase